MAEAKQSGLTVLVCHMLTRSLTHLPIAHFCEVLKMYYIKQQHNTKAAACIRNFGLSASSKSTLI